jgi:hypothetical protein
MAKIEKKASFARTVAEIENICNSDPYTSGEMEYVERRVGELADQIGKVRIFRRSIVPALVRLRKLHGVFHGIGGPYAPMIAIHLTRAIGNVVAKAA